MIFYIGRTINFLANIVSDSFNIKFFDHGDWEVPKTNNKVFSIFMMFLVPIFIPFHQTELIFNGVKISYNLRDEPVTLTFPC